MKYIDAEKLIAELEKKRDSALERQKNLEKIGQETVLNEMIAFELNRLLSFVASLQQEQPEQKKNCAECPHCVDRKDQYGWHFKGCFGGPYKGKFIAEIDECPLKQEQSKFNIPSDGSGAWGTTPPKFKLDVKPVESEVDLEKEVEKYLLDNADFVIKSTSNEMVNTLARHFYELGLNARKED